MVNEEEPQKSVLDEAKAVKEDIEKATASAKAEADRLERLKSDQLLSGTAGKHIEPPKELTPEQKIKEEAKEFWKGSEIEKSLKRHG